MIRKAIFITATFFFSYTLFVVTLAPTWWKTSQHQWQDNIIKAQRFIYSENNDFENVIVGSSLSCRLHTDRLLQTYNLSFGGQSIYEGLNILTRKEKIPKNVFIETNIAVMKENSDFNSALWSPLLFHTRKLFPSLRDEKQPIGIFGTAINGRILSPLLRQVKSRLHLEQGHQETENARSLFLKLLKRQTESYLRAPNQQLMNDCFDRLQRYVTELESRGANIVFFEMPVNSQLSDLPRAKIIRESFYKHFATSKYKYIPIPDNIKFMTSDGIHLNGEEALKYTIYLRSHIEIVAHPPRCRR